MPKKPHRPGKQPAHQKRPIAYVVDMQPGEHSYVFVEGVGECRAHFMRMVEALERGEGDILVVAHASLLFIDTSPMWIEKLIAILKRRGILIAATHGKDYDLRKPEDEATFRALRNT